MDYKRKQALEAIKMVALQNGASAGEVYQEIGLAIGSGLSNPDPKVQQAWKAVSCPGKTPTPEDIILYALETLLEDVSELISEGSSVADVTE